MDETDVKLFDDSDVVFRPAITVDDTSLDIEDLAVRSQQFSAADSCHTEDAVAKGEFLTSH